MLILMTLWGLLDTVTIVLSGALKGAGDTRFVMYYMVTIGWGILIPGVLLLLYLGYGIIALWIWLAIYVLVLSIGIGYRWRGSGWEKIKLIDLGHT